MRLFCARCVTFALFLVVATLMTSAVRADGDEALGPPGPGFDFSDGSYFVTAGVGLDGPLPATIELDVPADVTIRQVILYWSLFGPNSDTTVTLEGSIPVTGVPIGVADACLPADRHARSFRADVTDLGLVTNGHNTIEIDDLDPGPDPDSRNNGASLVVIVEEPGTVVPTLATDGCDFVVGTVTWGPCSETERQTFTFPPVTERSAAEVVLLVGDQEPGSDRTNAVEVEIQLGPSIELVNVLVGGDGRSWDTLVVPFEVPVGSSEVSVQVFSDDRAGTGGRPSSLVWVFTGVNFVEPPGCEFTLRIPDVTVEEGECVDVPVLLDSTCPIQGFTTALRHDPTAVELRDISLDGTVTAAVGAEFFGHEIVANGGTTGVVLDLESPFEDQTIPPGTGRRIVIYEYCCLGLPEGAPAITTALELVNDALGSPPKANAVVVDGLSIAPRLDSGSITCEPGRPESTYFICGGPSPDAEGGVLPMRPAAVGERRSLCLFYCAPEDGAVGHAQLDHLQGLTMTLCYDCNIDIDEIDFHVPEDSILEALGAEFVSFQADSDPADGDGCEMVFGVLVDALPPFDGATLPPTSEPMKLACVDVTVGPNAVCDTCLPIDFCDGINGRGRVPLKNLFAAENRSFSPQLYSCELCVVGAPRFFRGDCNSNDMVEVSDAAAVISSLFLQGAWRFEPRCWDACDCNDDGRADLADSVCILSYLFLHGAVPPAPGPDFNPATGGPGEKGSDPTADKIDCELRDCP